MSTPSIRMTWIFTWIGAGCLLYYFANRSNLSVTQEEEKNIQRRSAQVAFRDPKLIEEHKKKLEEINKKK